MREEVGKLLHNHPGHSGVLSGLVCEHGSELLPIANRHPRKVLGELPCMVMPIVAYVERVQAQVIDGTQGRLSGFSSKAGPRHDLPLDGRSRSNSPVVPRPQRRRGRRSLAPAIRRPCCRYTACSCRPSSATRRPAPGNCSEAESGQPWARAQSSWSCKPLRSTSSCCWYAHPRKAETPASGSPQAWRPPYSRNSLSNPVCMMRHNRRLCRAPAPDQPHFTPPTLRPGLARTGGRAGSAPSGRRIAPAARRAARTWSAGLR